MSHITLPLNEIYAPIEPRLVEVVAEIEDELVSELPVVAELCAAARHYRGKMLRPGLLLLTAESLGGVRSAHVTLAAVVEIVHLATLVHDDVLDEADLRPRQPTINALRGNEAAVLLGDYLISHAFHLCSSLDSQYAARLVGRTTNVVCEGELLQIQHRGDWSLTEATYFEIIRRKTAALTATACELGAHAMDVNPQVADAMRRYGEHSGIAFQIVDDVLDLVGEQQQVGKTLGRDLDLGKLTLPTIHFLAEAATGDREAFIAGVESGSPEVFDGLADRLRAAGSVDYALTTAQGYVQSALAELAVLPEGPARTALTALTEFIIRRDI